jgi:hypothetical protein
MLAAIRRVKESDFDSLVSEINRGVFYNSL